VRDLTAALKPHAERVGRYKKWDATYHGEMRALENQWQSDLHPPYAYGIIETIGSNVIELMPTVSVKASTADNADSAESHEALIRSQQRKDRFAKKQPAWIMQGLIRGISPAKLVWEYETRQETTFGVQSPEVGAQQGEVSKTVTSKNQPSFVTWDAMDFCWDPAATSDEDCHVFARTYDTIDSLRGMEKLQVYRNVDQVKTNTTPGDASRDTKGRVEVWERWTRDRVTTVANQSVVLRDDPNPFWHGEIPFVIFVPLPVPFRVEGKSFAELVRDQQRALWDISNQMVDNARRMNNLIRYYDQNKVKAELMDDLFPGKLVPVDGNPNNFVAPEQMPVSILEAGNIVAEGFRKDMQDVTGAVSYVSGAASETIDQTTATGISIVQNQALKRMQRVKQQAGYATQQLLYLWLKLNQQMIRTPITLRDGNEYPVVNPDELQGEYEFDVEDLEESLNQQQRRQEALVKAQTLAGLAPLMMGQINMAEVVRDISEAFGEDPDKYLVASQPPAGVPGMLPPGPAALQAPPPTPTPGLPAGQGGAPPAPYFHPGIAPPVMNGG
jgi:hypothetical protein